MGSLGGDRPPEDDRRQLQKDYPDWRIDLDHSGTLVCAWLPSMPRSANGLLVLKDADVHVLRRRMEVFVAVWGETHDRAAAEEAANSLVT